MRRLVFGLGVSQVARLGERAAKTDMTPLDSLKDVEGRVIIAGFGRVGQVIAHLLNAQGISHVGPDLDAGRIAELRKRGMMVFYGDT